MQYDVPAIIKRLTVLGEDPIKYFCHPDFETPYYKFNYDMIYKNDIKNSSDNFECTSYSMWVDQMRNYAGIRKSLSDYGGNSLDNVAGIELKSEKRRYSSKTVSVINGAIEEYWNFVKYSINDVLLQYGIDNKTGDLNALFEQSLYGATRFSKVLKQSVYLKNYFQYKYLANYDIVPMNNINVNYRSGQSVMESQDSIDDIELRGALVADPMLNSHTGIKILGKRSFTLFECVYDEDYSSMYPNIKITANMAPHTQIGRLIIEKKLIEDENPDNDPKFMRGGKFIEDYTTDDGSVIGRWIGLHSIYDYLKEFKASCVIEDPVKVGLIINE